ncbi:GGDEF domain-containing protein [Corallincola platygyrae]|uniref:diguanylate cyclase n=1 Tax=Corallincola platygyrae TaxID=1193278 RepID=A0ABW4XTF3_9GAMM
MKQDAHSPAISAPTSQPFSSGPVSSGPVSSGLRIDIDNLDEAEVRLQQLHLYVDNHQHDRLLAPMLALITGSVLSIWVTWQVAALWMLVAFLITRNYLRVYNNFKQADPEAADVVKWERRIATAHGMHMLHWGGLCIWAWQPGVFENHIFIAMIVLGLMCATTAMSSPSYRLFIRDMAPVVIIGCARPLFEEGLLYHAMSALSVCFSILMVNVGLQIHRNLLRMLCLQQERRQLITELENMATTDALTGVSNRRAFIQCASEEINRSRRYEHPLSLLMIDIDHFKKVNDTFGHAMGDEVIKQVAQMIERDCRHNDRLARFGGEEFAVLLPESEICLAELTAERIRQRIESTEIIKEGQEVRVTISVGVAELSATDQHIDRLLDVADKRLYQAKNNGRNRVETA